MSANRGIDLSRERAEQSEGDWFFGAVSKSCLATIPQEARQSFLPIGELQYGAEDFQDCASRGPINLLEAKFTYLYTNNKLLPENRKWLENKGYVQGGKVTFSDRWIAVKSGTTRTGNSLKAPLEAIRKHGLIPKSMLSKPEGGTWEQYHDPSKLTPEMTALGQEWVQRFIINYEKVNILNFEQALNDDFVNLALFAWGQPVDNEYQDTGLPPNHVVIGFKLPKTYIFDNYIDQTDGDFIKKLAPNYTFFDYGYRVFISKEITPEDHRNVLTVFQTLQTHGLLAFFSKFLEKFYGSIWK